MNRKQLGAFVAGALTIVGGGFAAKYLDATAGDALVAAGGYLMGLAQKQPRAFHHSPGPIPDKEQP